MSFAKGRRRETCAALLCAENARAASGGRPFGAAFLFCADAPPLCTWRPHFYGPALTPGFFVEAAKNAVRNLCETDKKRRGRRFFLTFRASGCIKYLN